jgi:hypothetical protein
MGDSTWAFDGTGTVKIMAGSDTKMTKRVFMFNYGRLTESV